MKKIVVLLSSVLILVSGCSIYTLSDVRNIITNTSIRIPCLIISLIISIVFITLSYIRYNKKELV